MKSKTALAALACLLATAATAEADRPNIVLIEVDDLTYKYVGAFGAQHVRTPNIDALAERGVLFENAVVQGCMCAPSRNSLMTGRYPQNLGLYSNGDIRQMPAEQWAFPTALREAGYHTSWIGKSHILPYKADQKGRGGVKKTGAMKDRMGFDEVWQSAGRHVALKKARELAADPGGKWKRGIDAYADYLYDNDLLDRFVEDGSDPTTLDVDDYLDGFIAKKSIDWLDGYDRGEPFFLWVNFSGPHGPYNPPAEYLGRYQPGDAPHAIKDDDHSDIPGVLRPHQWRKPQDAIPQERATYADMISFMDEQVGRVVQAIESKGIADNTVIVFFSDHGIMEGDHGLMHKETLYKEVLNACLIVVDPAGRSGQRVSRPVELLDVADLSLDLAEASQAALEESYGESLAPLVRGNPDDYPRRFAVAQVRGATALVTPRYKYIHTDSQPVLFDLSSDPDELENVADENAELCKRFEQLYQQWKSAHGPVK